MYKSFTNLQINIRNAHTHMCMSHRSKRLNQYYEFKS